MKYLLFVFLLISIAANAGTNQVDGILVSGKSPTLAVFTQTASVTVADTTTETKLTGAGVGSTTIPANYLVAGKTYKISMAGVHSSAGSPNTTFRLRLGGTSGTSIGSAGSAIPDAINGYWSADIIFTYRGSSAVIASGVINIPGSDPMNISSTSTTSITPSSALEITPTVQWDTADTGNTITCQILTITEMN